MFFNLCAEHAVLVSRRFPVQLIYKKSRKKYRKEALSSFPVSFLADLTIHHKMRRRQLAGKTCWFQENPERVIAQSDFPLSLPNSFKNARTWRNNDLGQRKSLPFQEEGAQIGIQ